MALRSIDITNPETRVSDKTVELLEYWLEKARTGQVRDIIVAGDTGNGNIAVNASATLDVVRQLGMVELIRAHIHRQIDDQ